MGIGIQQSQSQLNERVVRPFIQLGAGYNNLLIDGKTTATPIFAAGVNVNTKSGFHGAAEAKLGAPLELKLEAGQKIPLNNKWDLDLTGKADYKKQYIAIKIDTPDSYTSREIKLGAQAEAQYTTGKFELGIGLEGGYRKEVDRTRLGGIEIDPDGPGCWTEPNPFRSRAASTSSANKEESSNALKAKGYITPTVSAKYNINEAISIVTNADLTQGEAGVRFTF
jgi:hypothetical protein